MATPMVSCGPSHSLGLKSDGTCVGTGYNNSGEIDVSGWTDIIETAAGNNHSLGLKSDGTAVGTGYNYYGQIDVSGWTDIIHLNAEGNQSLGVKPDGTVVAVGSNIYDQLNVSGWTDIIAVAAGEYHSLGLKSDGTVVGVGYNYYGQTNVSGWTDIIEIAAKNNLSLGLKSDGTVVGAGTNFNGETDVSGWTNITKVAAGGSHSLGLKPDGTVVAVGANWAGQINVSGWTDIVAIGAGDSFSLGVKSDGTVVGTGINDGGQIDVSTWDLGAAAPEPQSDVLPTISKAAVSFILLPGTGLPPLTLSVKYSTIEPIRQPYRGQLFTAEIVDSIGQSVRLISLDVMLSGAKGIHLTAVPPLIEGQEWITNAVPPFSINVGPTKLYGFSNFSWSLYSGRPNESLVITASEIIVQRYSSTIEIPGPIEILPTGSLSSAIIPGAWDIIPGDSVIAGGFWRTVVHSAQVHIKHGESKVMVYG